MSIEIAPASLDQVIRGRGGKLINIDSDVGNIAKNLKEIDPRLKVSYNESGKFFAVYREHDDGSDLVTTANELDERIIDRVRKVYDPQYDFNAEADKLEKAGKRKADHEFAEKVGDASERLAHAIRSDIRRAAPGPVYIPPDISPGRSRVYLSGGRYGALRGTDSEARQADPGTDPRGRTRTDTST